MASSFDRLRDAITRSERFQGACQRYAHANGTSAAITAAALVAILGADDGEVDQARTALAKAQTA